MIFVMGSFGPDAQEIFSEEKDIVNEIIKKYEPQDVKYSLIQYETEGRKLVGFNDFKDISKFKRFVEILTWKGDGVGLEDALKKANSLFDEEGRPFSRRILVVFTDGRVDSAPTELEEAVKPLKEKNVKIIPVVLKEPADETNIRVLLPKDKNPVRKSSQKPEDTDDNIKEEIHKGKCFSWCSVGNSSVVNSFVPKFISSQCCPVHTFLFLFGLAP